MKINKYIIIIIVLSISLLLVSCSAQTISQNHFTRDEKVAYTFLKGVYSGNKVKENVAINSLVSNNRNAGWIIRHKLSNHEFSFYRFQGVEIIKRKSIIDNSMKVDLILVKIHGRTIIYANGVKSGYRDVIRNNIVYIVNHKILLNIMPNDDGDKQDYDRLIAELDGL